MGRAAFGDEDLAYVEALAAILASGVSRAVRESRLTVLAFEDPLTGLANRRRLDRVAATIFPARTDVVVVSLDVNEMKQSTTSRDTTPETGFSERSTRPYAGSRRRSSTCPIAPE